MYALSGQIGLCAPGYSGAVYVDSKFSSYEEGLKFAKELLQTHRSLAFEFCKLRLQNLDEDLDYIDLHQ